MSGNKKDIVWQVVILYFHVKKSILIGLETFDKNQYHTLNHETTP